MSILVVCPGCKKSFQVSEKFAGKTGPCPKCKATIQVPEKGQQVEVHTPEEFGTGGRGVTGQLALKPIARAKFKVNQVTIAAIAGGAVGVVIVTAVLGRGIVGDNPDGQRVLGTIGLLLLSPLLAVAAYGFLRDDELEPYRGVPLYIRAAACAAVYMFLWGGFVYVKGTLASDNQSIELWQWFVLLPPFFVGGTVAAWLSLDLEPTNGFFHYAFYLFVTMLLGWVAGFGWAWGM